VGKADLGRTLAEATGRTHLSVGHMLREEAKKDTEEAQMINQSIQMGVLVATVSMRASWYRYLYSFYRYLNSLPKTRKNLFVDKNRGNGW